MGTAGIAGESPGVRAAARGVPEGEVTLDGPRADVVEVLEEREAMWLNPAVGGSWRGQGREMEVAGGTAEGDDAIRVRVSMMKPNAYIYTSCPFAQKSSKAQIFILSPSQYEYFRRTHLDVRNRVKRYIKYRAFHEFSVLPLSTP